jgi:hypothetical protein|nr:hypothetical protein [Neorhizobium tomejilense]
MQDNIKTPMEKALANISRMIGSEIVAAGDDNLSMGFLSNAFSTAIYAYVGKVGQREQLAILADPSLQDIALSDASINTRNVSTVIASTVCEALSSKMRSKMVEMCRHIHHGRAIEVLSAVASVLERASLENDPSFDPQALRDAAAFAREVCSNGLPEDYRGQLGIIPQAMSCLVERRRDKAFIARLGEPLAKLVRLTNKTADLVHLDEIDPEGFRAAVGQEVTARRSVAMPLAA